MTQFEQDLINKINYEADRIGFGYITIGLKISNEEIIKLEFTIQESVEIPRKSLENS